MLVADKVQNQIVGKVVWTPQGDTVDWTTDRVSNQLIELRHGLEYGTEITLDQLEVNAVVLLNDVCHALSLNDDQRRRVLGEAGWEYIQYLEGVTVRPTTRVVQWLKNALAHL